MTSNWFDVSEVQFAEHPFEHFLSKSFFSPDFGSALLTWFETEAPWVLVEKEFYEQYEFSFAEAALPADLRCLVDPHFLSAVRRNVEHAFSVALSSTVTLVAHKLVAGQSIRIHNDFIDDGETHRLLVQVNRQWVPEQGGFLLIFGSDSPDDVEKIILPHSNSTLAFRISPTSHHAVSKINSGERYTLVFSFYLND